MLGKLLRGGILVTLGLALSGHTPGTVGEGSEEVDLQPRMYVQEINPWTHLEWNDDPANFQFAIVADRTGGHRKGVFEDAVGKLNLLQPEFVMSVGDLIEGYTEDVPLIRDQWEEFQGFVDALEMSFFYVPGNHDITNLVQVEDERSVLDAAKHPWGQDGIEVRLDARPDPLRSNGTGQGEQTDIIFVGMSPGEKGGEMVYYQREAVEKQGVEASCAKTENGFFAEIAVPRAYMDEKQGSAWEKFRLNIAVDDIDEQNGTLAQLWWRPDWRKGKNYPGSGTFVKR